MGFGWTAMKIGSKIRLLRTTYRIPLCLIFLNVGLAFHHQVVRLPYEHENGFAACFGKGRGFGSGPDAAEN